MINIALYLGVAGVRSWVQSMTFETGRPHFPSLLELARSLFPISKAVEAPWSASGLVQHSDPHLLPMDPLAAAARAAAAPSLDAVPVPLFGQVTPEALSAAKASLLTGLSDALVAGIGLPSILAAATAAHAGFAAAREEARARAALTADA